MRWTVKAFRKLTKEDAIADIGKIPNFARLEEYIYVATIHRASWGLIDTEGFDEVMDAYRLKHRELTGTNDFYELTERDAGLVIANAWKELKSHKDNVQGAEYAADMVLKQFPNNVYALKLKDALGKAWNTPKDR